MNSDDEILGLPGEQNTLDPELKFKFSNNKFDYKSQSFETKNPKKGNDKKALIIFKKRKRKKNGRKLF